MNRKKAVKRPPNWLIPSRDVRELCRRAKGGDLSSPVALGQVWRLGIELAATIREIAGTNPERLHAIARGAIYVPALLSASKVFNNEALAITARLPLGENTLLGTNPRCHLDKPATRIVVTVVSEAEAIREHLQACANEFDPEALAALNAGGKPSHSTRRLKRYLRSELKFAADELRLLSTGPLNEKTEPVWWEQVLKPYLEKKLTLKAIRDAQPGFHSEIEAASTASLKGTRHYKSPADILKQRCRSALKGISRPPRKA